MDNNLIVLDLVGEARITVEEALQLLSAMTGKTPPQPGDDREHRIELKLIFERDKDV